MRGTPQGHRGGRRPGQPPRRWGQPVPHITDAVLSPEAFMKAVASTEDRRTFDRIVGNTSQSQHPSFQLRTGQQRWRPVQTVQDDEFAGSNDTQTSGSPSANVLGTSTGKDVPSIPREAMLGNSSTPWGQTRERGSASMQATIDDTTTFMSAALAMTANRHQLGTPPEKVDLPGTPSQRFDIATLKHWQPAKGGTTLAVAKEAGFRMQALLSPEEEPPLDRPPVKIKHANMPHTLKDPLYQVHKADHGDAGDDGEVRAPAIPHPALPSQLLQADATEVKDNIELVTVNTSPTTIRPRIEVHLLDLNENRVSTIDGEDMARFPIPYRPTLPGTENALTSTRSNTPSQSQDVIPKGGNRTGGASAFENKERNSIAKSNTLLNDKAKGDEATKRIVTLNHTMPDDSYMADSAPEAPVNQGVNAEDEQRLSSKFRHWSKEGEGGQYYYGRCNGGQPSWESVTCRPRRGRGRHGPGRGNEQGTRPGRSLQMATASEISIE